MLPFVCLKSWAGGGISLKYPMLVLKDFFNKQSLDEWRISEWTEYALCATSVMQETENYNLLQHYEQL